MNPQHLVKMANQIEAFFRNEPDRASAVDAIANHFRRFWDPRMRRELAAFADLDGSGLGDVARDAIARVPTVCSDRAKGERGE